MTTHVTEPPREAVEAAGNAPCDLAARRADARPDRPVRPVSADSPDSAPTSTARRASTRAAWVGLGAVGLLGVLVFWVFEALPFQDLPAHAGLIAMRHRFTDGSFESRFFVLAPHIGPYSLFRFLGESCFLVRILEPRTQSQIPSLRISIATGVTLLSYW